MRIQWDEKAKRLAEKYELIDSKDMIINQIEVALTQPNGISEIGIITDDNRKIYWYLKENWIYCNVKGGEK